MTTNDFDGIARAWLQDGPDRMSDRALQTALEEVHLTRQRRAWWPALRPGPTGLIRAAALAVVVVGVGLAAVSLLPRGNSGGGGGGAPTPTPTPTPRPLTLSEEPVPIEAGTYTTTDPYPVRFTATVPAGWTGHIIGPYGVWLERDDGPGALGFAIFDKVYADPCDVTRGLMSPLPGPSVDDLASALASLPGVEVTAPTDVMLDGYPGKHLTMTAPGLVGDCTLADGTSFRIWELPFGETNDMALGERDEISILDVDGVRLVIRSIEAPDQTAEARAEQNAILDSVRIESVASSPAPS